MSETDKTSTPVTTDKGVATGRVRKKKASAVARITKTLFGNDLSTVKDGITHEVIIPTIQGALRDSLMNSVDALFGRNTRRTYGTPASRVSYRDYYETRNYREDDYYRRPSGYDFDDVLFDSQTAAEAVLDRMNETLARYGIVKVLDFYDFSRVPGRSHTDAKYGWTDLRRARIAHVKDGWVIELPKAMPID